MYVDENGTLSNDTSNDTSQGLMNVFTNENQNISTGENNTFIGVYSVSFARRLSTNDSQDVELTRSVNNIFWIYGPMINF